MKKKLRNILYIDDEQDNLDVFYYTLFKDFEIFLANSAKEGKKILEKENIQVIITDHRMPEMSGVEFLASIVNEYPDPIRIVLTGYKDFDVLVNAINKGQIYQFISKPWNKDEMKILINNALEIYQLRMRNKQIISRLQESNEMLKHKSTKLERNYNSKSKQLAEFEFITAHNLKSPLRTISTLTEWLNTDFMDDLPKKIRENVSEINSTVKNMNHMIDGLLDYAKIGMSERFPMKNHDLHDIIKLIKDKLEVARKVEVTEKIDPTVNFKLNAYELEKLLTYLIDNAIKFNESDPIEIKIDVFADEVISVIRIKDNGIGIDEKYHVKIFNLFFSLPGENIEQGLGMGLALSKK